MERIEFEEDSAGDVISNKRDDYDLELGIALSKSLSKNEGIASPEEVQKMVNGLLEQLLEE
jgi:hypothetical protein